MPPRCSSASGAASSASSAAADAPGGPRGTLNRIGGIMAIPPWTPVTHQHPALDPDALAAQAEGIRRLCRSLVHDAARADDVAQETMRLAIERPPRPGWNLYAWLSGVARNVARGMARSDRRRAGREVKAGRPEGTPSTLDA